MVKTDFSLRRFDGDEDRADAVYEGVTPLVADDIAEVIGFVARRPSHVDLDLIVVTPARPGQRGEWVPVQSEVEDEVVGQVARLRRRQ